MLPLLLLLGGGVLIYSFVVNKPSNPTSFPYEAFLGHPKDAHPALYNANVYATPTSSDPVGSIGEGNRFTITGISMGRYAVNYINQVVQPIPGSPGMVNLVRTPSTGFVNIEDRIRPV